MQQSYVLQTLKFDESDRLLEFDLNNLKKTVPKSADNQSYFAQVSTLDLRSLALMRIGLALVLIYDLIDRSAHFSAHYLDSGAFPYSAVSDYYAGFPTWSLHTLSTSSAYVGILIGIHLLLAVMLLVGCKTRLATVGVWILQASLMARLPLMTNGADVLMIAALFWSMFLPLGARYSVDQQKQIADPDKNRTATDSVFGIAALALVTQLVLMYFITGIMKFNDHWIHGTALQSLFTESSLTRPFGTWLTDFPAILSVLTIGVLTMEIIGPLFFLSPWKTSRCRGLALIGFISMHIGIELTMDVPLFSYVSCAVLLGLVPSTWWSTRRMAAAEPISRQVFPRLACGICLTAVVLYNFMTVIDQDRTWAGRTTSTHMIHQLRLDQQWSMFDNPDIYIYRFSAPATLADGRQLDLLHDDSIVNGLRVRPDSVDTFTSQRWMLALRQLVSPSYQMFAAQACEYLMSNPDEVIPGLNSDSILSLELSVYVGAEKSISSNEPQLLAYVERHADGSYKNGMRHGLWVTKHANGNQQSTGRYEHGLEQGEWKYFDQSGAIEAKGPFVDGKLHGNWTFYYSDGQSVDVLYRDDQQVKQATTENGRLH